MRRWSSFVDPAFSFERLVNDIVKGESDQGPQTHKLLGPMTTEMIKAVQLAFVQCGGIVRGGKT